LIARRSGRRVVAGRQGKGQVGVLTGLAMEARCLRGLDAVVACSSARAQQARAEALRLVEEGVAGLVSFGLAGALDPALRPGDLVIAEAVILPGGWRLEVDAGWRARLGAASGAHLGAVAGSDRLLATAAMKREVRERTGALAVDMESHVVAEAAAAAGLPFAVIRAIGDPAERALPLTALAFVNPQGRIRAGAVIGILARPLELAALLRLGLETRAALRTLRRAAPLLGGLG
jgi:adenosylhomocysteine nucleosidase